MTRRLYIDWLRGVAVLCMILWHVVDAWTVTTGRDTSAFFGVAFLAGWAAPLFLFLAGVSVPMAAAARERQGFDRRSAARALQRRGWQIFGLAHLFRFQSFLLNANGSWGAIFKPDILNVLGLGVVVSAALWRRAVDGRRVVLLLLVPAVVVAFVLTPWAPSWYWPSLLHPRLEAYVRPVGNYGVFSLFPSLAYLFCGAAFGAWLQAKGDHVLRSLAVPASIAVAAGVGATLALRPEPTTWFFSGVVFVWRTGAMVLLLWIARRLLERVPGQASGVLVLFGQTSLFVYWVHVELVYGVFSYPLHHAFPLAWSLAAYIVVTMAMAMLARRWSRRQPGAPWIPRHMAAAA